MKRALALLACAAGCAKSPLPPSVVSCAGDFVGAPLGIRCGALVDAEGRDVLLHGINARIHGLFDDTLDDGSLTFGPIPAFTDGDPAAIRAMGFNALRLPLDWSAIEPTESGGFDDAYLDRAATVIDALGSAGVRVLVDLHQDGFTKYIGDDGAPKWAVLPPPPARDPADPNRNIDGPAAQAFATFFGPGADGIRLRQRYAALLVHVAQRFATDDAVLGFELFNEPFATDASLLPFDAEMITALRSVVPAKLLFFEPSAIRNVLDFAPLASASLGPGTVYAPHVYTGVFAKVVGPITKEKLRPSNESARMEADAFGAPLAITEWGFGPTDPMFPDFVKWQEELHDEYLASAFFWVWKEIPPSNWGFFDIDPKTFVATPRASAITAFSRVRLEAAAGKLASVTYDRAGRAFQIDFSGDAGITAPNLISIGATPDFAAFIATCDGNPVGASAGEPVAIACGGAGPHTVRLVAR